MKSQYNFSHRNTNLLKLLICSSLACLISISLSAPTVAQSMEDIEIKVEKVSDGIYMLIGQGGNIGLSIGDDGAFVIDDQFAPLTDKILSAISTVTDKPVKFVINTHWHGDHSGGNEPMAESGAIIVAHDNVRTRLMADRPAMGNRPASPGATGKALPVVTFKDGVTFHWNSQTVDVKHVLPSHTDGDSLVIFKPANVIHSGDVFPNSGYPYIDAGSGGNIHGFVANARTLLGLMDEETLVIPGHGPVTNKAQVEKFLEVLELAIQRIGDLKNQGKTVEEIQALKPMVEFDAEWGQGFMNPDNFIAGVYNTL